MSTIRGVISIFNTVKIIPLVTFVAKQLYTKESHIYI